MDGPRGYYVNWNKSNRERQIKYGLTYKWNWKNKTNEQTKLNRNRFIDPKNKKAVARRGKSGEGEISEGDQEVQTSSCRINESWVWKCISEGKVNNYVMICMVTDGNEIYHNDHFEMHKNIKSLCCVTKTNIVL